MSGFIFAQLHGTFLNPRLAEAKHPSRLFALGEMILFALLPRGEFVGRRTNTLQQEVLCFAHAQLVAILRGPSTTRNLCREV